MRETLVVDYNMDCFSPIIFIFGFIYCRHPIFLHDENNGYLIDSDPKKNSISQNWRLSGYCTKPKVYENGCLATTNQCQEGKLGCLNDRISEHVDDKRWGRVSPVHGIRGLSTPRR